MCKVETPERGKRARRQNIWQKRNLVPHEDTRGTTRHEGYPNLLTAPVEYCNHGLQVVVQFDQQLRLHHLLFLVETSIFFRLTNMLFQTIGFFNWRG